MPKVARLWSAGSLAAWHTGLPSNYDLMILSGMKKWSPEREKPQPNLYHSTGTYLS